MKLSELIESMQGVSAKLEQVKAEIVAKIIELQTALADVDVPEAAQAAIADLSAKAQALDDIVPDPE